MATPPPAASTDTPPKKRRGFLRRIKWIALGLVLLVALLVALAPTIAGPLARPIVQSEVNNQIKGHAEIGALRLSWLGAQRVALTLDDPAGGRVADVAVRAEKGLLGLAFGSRDLGLVYVSGEATIVRGADGQTNLQRAIEPRYPKPEQPPKPGEPAQLPDSLAASVVLDDLAVTYQDAALAEQTGGRIGVASAPALRGSLDFAVGAPLRLSIEGPLRTGPSVAELADSGAIDVEATVTSLTDADGNLTPEAMAAEAVLSLRAPAIDAVAHAAYANRTVTSTGETRVILNGAEIATLVPRIAEALAAQPDVQVNALPTITVSVGSLRLPLGGDMRGAAASIDVRTTEIAGTITLPQGEQRVPSGFRIEPLALSLDAPSLAETVTLKGGTRASIGEASAGEISVDLAVGGLLDEAGALRASMPAQVAGGLQVEGFSTLILQPFVAAVSAALPQGGGLDLPTDIGPTLDATVAAESGAEAGAYDIDLSLRAERAEIRGALAIAGNGQRISAREGGVHARFASLAPLVGRLAAPYGVHIQRGDEVTIDAQDFAIDLAKLGGPEGPDLRGAAASVSVAAAGYGGTFQPPGQEQPVDFTIADLALGVSTADAAGEVRITGNAAARVAGSEAGGLRSDITLSNLLGPGGAPATGALPTLRGEVRADALNMGTLDRLLAPWLGASGITLAQDLGGRGDALLLAAPNAEAGEDATDLDLTFRSKNLDVTAPLTVTPDRIRTREPMMLVGRTAGATLAKLLGEEGPASIAPGGSVRVALADVDVPFEPGFKVRPDRARVGLTATLTDMAVDVRLADAPVAAGESAGRRPAKPVAPQRVAVPRLVASAALAPGEAPSITVDGELSHDGQPFALAVSATLHELFLAEPAVPGDPMSVLAPAGVRPKSRITLTGIPATLARIVPPSLAAVGEQSLDATLLARDTLGRTFDIEITTTPVTDDPTLTAASLELRGERLSSTLRFRHAPEKLIRVQHLSGNVGITSRVAEHLGAIFAPEAPVPGLASPAVVTFSLAKAVSIPLAGGLAPDLAKLRDVVQTTVTMDASFAATTLPAEEGAEPMTIPAFSIKGLSIGAAAPLTVMGESGGEATATISGKLLQADGSGLADLAGEARASLASGKPAGPMPLKVTLTNVAGRWIDGVLGKPALVAGALGDVFGLSLTADPNLVLARDASAPALSLTINAPRLKTDVPISLEFNKRAVFISEVVTAQWTIGPAWGNHYIFGRKAGGPEPALTLVEPTRANIRVQRLAIAMGEGAGPLKPGIFLLDATVTLPDAQAKMSDGRIVRLAGTEFKLGRGPTPDQIGFALAVPRMQLGDQPAVTPEKNRITGRLAKFADEAGNPSVETARLNLSGGFAPIPTDLIDALARQNGMLRDALGPTVDFDIEATEFSMDGGTLRAIAVTPLARADIRGRVREGLFIVNPESVVQVSEITPAFTERFLQKALPVIGSLEKTRADEPAKVIFHTPIAVPLDGNFDRLNGELTFDIGTARFGTEDLFQKVLSVAQQKTAGEVGRRLPPLRVTMADGLVSYLPLALPFGEFTLETQGFINLSSKPRQIFESGGDALAPKHLEVLTFIPTGAFVSEAVPGLSLAPGVGRLPIRTSGPIASPKNGVAADLVGRNAVGNLLQPDKLLDGGGRKLLEDLLGGGED
jgi:hypothetical protein